MLFIYTVRSQKFNTAQKFEVLKSAITFANYFIMLRMQVCILGLYLGKHLQFRLQKMPNMYQIM